MAMVLAGAACGRSGPPARGGTAPGNDDDTTTPATATPTPRPAIPGDLVINEVYFNISGCSTADCDANRSGAVNSVKEEFVEIVNVAGVPVFLDGVEIWDSDQSPERFEFGPDTALAPLCAAVVFAGLEGTSAGSPAFGGSLVFESPEDLDLNNSGDTVTLKDGIRVFTSVTWDGSTTSNFSWVLQPEITGGANYVMHSAHLDEGGTVQRNSSPGWRADFTPF